LQRLKPVLFQASKPLPQRTANVAVESKAEVIGHQGEVGIGPDQAFGAGERAGPNPVWLIRFDRLPGALVAAPIAIVIPVEIEHIEQVSDGRHVDGNIGIVIVGARIGQVIAAALAELAEMPIPLDEFHKGRVFPINVVDVTAP
jgi:hypothetical protein